jgi:hypothetical protein
MPPTSEAWRAVDAGLGNLSCVAADGFENRQDRPCAQAESHARLNSFAARPSRAGRAGASDMDRGQEELIAPVERSGRGR